MSALISCIATHPVAFLVWTFSVNLFTVIGLEFITGFIQAARKRQ